MLNGEDQAGSVNVVPCLWFWIWLRIGGIADAVMEIFVARII